jgi:hypothetical protein
MIKSEDDNVRKICSTPGGGEKYMQNCTQENLKEIIIVMNVGIDIKIILK